MELKKISLFSVIGLLAMSSFTFSACSDDDDDDKSNGKTDTISHTDSLALLSESQGVTVSGKIGNYTYVDLGLASKTKWATYNVGASKPWESGDYFAWGEVATKASYTWKTYKWCKDSCNKLTKYCHDEDFGTVDGKETLTVNDDAAYANWNDNWRMPTSDEMKELVNGCDWEWTWDFNETDVSGCIGTSKTNGNTIFIPAAGFHKETKLTSNSYVGCYWTSSLNDVLDHKIMYDAVTILNGSDFSYEGSFMADTVYVGSRSERYCGNTVRAVLR